MAPRVSTLARRGWRPLLIGAAAIALFGGLAPWRTATGATFLAPPSRLPAAAYDAPAGDTAVLSGGCFWGMQGVFQHVKGVKQVLSGYAGGGAGTANYELVSTGTTGHAESIKISFDPAQVSYAEILRIYFSVATDPTQIGGQFPDQGTQYRGEIWYQNPVQKQVAERYIAQLTAAKAFHHPITTRVDAYSGFYPAEAYHQDYLVHHPGAPYIATYDMPKVDALKKYFPTAWRPAPVLALASR
ncbi:MAG TPA: peptide-methionine (S)-S-oxide reductase MsrA [Caulobacteraceae bacterium]|jgi:peptide-methionine (S)-S-oxide reductase|nr:peptide-methionine (S)-S-oxide reductase MsrA [Caulobacteraceae bacterium]